MSFVNGRGCRLFASGGNGAEGLKPVSATDPIARCCANFDPSLIKLQVRVRVIISDGLARALCRVIAGHALRHVALTSERVIYYLFILARQLLRHMLYSGAIIASK